MGSFEESMKSNVLLTGKNDPAATDLDYYSKPENYTGSNLQSLQRFVAAKNEEGKQTGGDEKKTVIKDAKYHFFNRYKHILHDAIFVGDLLEREKEESSDEESGEEIEIQVTISPDKETRDERSRPRKPKDLVTITEEDEFSSKNKSPQRSRTSVDPHSGQSERIMSPISTGSSMLEGCLDTMESPTFGSAKHKKSISAGRQSTAIQRVKMDEMSRKIRAKQLFERFRRSSGVIQAIIRLASPPRGKAAGGQSAMRTFMDIADDSTNTEENMKSLGLSFDPNYFKAIREISLSSETKAILTMPSERRTPEQVQTAMFGLQSLRSYAEYPLHMQEKLAKVAWYEIVAPKRIIIRQGHFAENFYFVLSGHAVVTILLRDPRTGSSFVKTAMVMKKGMSFGELALLHHSKRTATVTSQDTVQLLSIGREDFFDIFMASSGTDAMPDHIKFISNIDFMKDWPIQELVDHPEHCLLHFFKRNTVIVSNSNQSDWMYIVKSGSCQVFKKLKGVTANMKNQTRQKLEDGLENIPKSKLKALVFAPKVDTGLRRKRTMSKGDTEKDVDQSEDDDKNTGNKDTSYSKEKYSQNPATKKAHFSANSSFAKRKGYTPPKQNIPKKPETPVEPQTPSKPPPVFVQVSNLKPRDVFGLESVDFDDDLERSHTAVTLISRGAECVMLSKAFYTLHANELVKGTVRHTVHPYPDEDVFQENLQIKEDWFMYKNVLLNDVTSQIHENHPKLCRN